MNSNVKLPDFLIVGTMKSGTSTLASYLDTHESIHIPSKELHFFNVDERFSQGASWYADKLKKTFGKSENYDTQLVGEKTPTYSYQQNCAQRIKETIPDVKLIWIFRNPVKRAFSNYLHRHKRGSELLSFRSAVARESKRIKKDIFTGYLDRSRYATQVERFLQIFNRDQMLFLLFEDLLGDAQAELRKVTDFLGIDPFENEVPIHHSNPTVMPFSPFSLWIAKNIAGYDSKLYGVTRKINTTLARNKPKIAEDLFKKLQNEFKHENQRLAEITGLNLSVWETN